MDNWDYEHAVNPVIIGGTVSLPKAVELYTGFLLIAEGVSGPGVHSIYSDWESVTASQFSAPYNYLVSDGLIVSATGTGIQQFTEMSSYLEFGLDDTLVASTTRQVLVSAGISSSGITATLDQSPVINLIEPDTGEIHDVEYNQIRGRWDVNAAFATLITCSMEGVVDTFYTLATDTDYYTSGIYP